MKNTENLPEEDIEAIEEAKIVPSEYGYSCCFILHSGEKKYIPLSTNCNAVPGDPVDLEKLQVLTLGRPGSKDIFRVMI